MPGKTLVIVIIFVLFGIGGILAIRQNLSTRWNSRDVQERFTNLALNQQAKASRQTILRSYFEAAGAGDLYRTFYSVYDSDKTMKGGSSERSSFGSTQGDSVGIVRVSEVRESTPEP